MNISNIQPSQLYISSKKYTECVELFRRKGIRSCEPIPVKTIGSDTFFTDGHTRALILWENGVEELKVYNDPDDLDWIAYLADLQWCREEKIGSISDLKNRIVDEEDYKENWIRRCDELHEKLINDPLSELKIEFEKDGKRKKEICDEILHSLPEWFGIESAIEDYTKNVQRLHFITACLYGKPVGFCAIKFHYGTNCELYVLGMFKEFHNCGIGTRMSRAAEVFARENKMRFLTVKTLSEKNPDQNYAKTRKFYTSYGFKPLEEFPTLWDKHNPCLYMIKEVEPS
jgi:ribosomal protein S18 acetylase RimI-like enzyme